MLLVWVFRELDDVLRVALHAELVASNEGDLRPLARFRAANDVEVHQSVPAHA